MHSRELTTMDLELLKRFYIVAEEGTIGRAAQRIHVVPSALTRSISDFENQLQTKLFDRVPKGMRLTPQGERLHAFARQILEQTDSFEKAFHEKEEEISGELKIVTTPFTGTDWLVPSLKNFLEKNPDIKIRILLRSENIDPLEGDVTICSFIPHQPHLIQKPLLSGTIRLFASQDYLKKFGIPQKPEDLDNHRLITYKGNYYTAYGSTNWILNLGLKNEQPSRQSYFEIDSLHGMLNSALQGYGIVELPDLLVPPDIGLKEVMPEVTGPFIELYYIFPDNRKNSKKINKLYKHLVKKGKP